MSTAIDQPAYLPTTVIVAEQLADQAMEDIRRGIAHPDVLYMGLSGACNAAGQRAYMRRLQKALEVAHAQA